MKKDSILVLTLNIKGGKRGMGRKAGCCVPAGEE